MLNKIKSNIWLLIVILFSVLILAVNLKINFYRYNNFDFGKFDLGNMSQMLWYTLHGKVLWLTDYFGTNLPRWAMSHVDPILLIFVPLFALIPHPMTLVVLQLVLVIFSSVLIYLIANLELRSKPAAAILGLAYLFYPAIGFLTAWTGFHGVTVAIPFFLGAFYLYELMYKKGNVTKKGLVIFWILLVLTMMGKEQLPLYILIYGIFIWLFRKNFKLGLSMMSVGAVWFALAFFVIIPAFAHYRVDGYRKFAESLSLSTTTVRDVENSNYFLSRYEEFGDSYADVAIGMITHPKLLVEVIFGGQKLDNFRRTFQPVGYLPLAYPPLFIMSFPDILINYSTTAGGIGTAEIYNHRVSMIVPVVFLSVIYAIGFFAGSSKKKFVVLGLSTFVLGMNIYTSYTYNNPVFLWLTQAVQKRVTGLIAFAKTDTEVAFNEDLKVGDIVRLTPLENKDRECAREVIGMIPDEASVSGPDYLGAHLSLRETYAIFPALYHDADYVIVDVFSRKILTILDVDITLVRDVVGDLIKDENYRLEAGCGNLFVFKKVGPHGKTTLLPLQERFSYTEKYNFEMLETFTVVDYKIPSTIVRGESGSLKYVFTKRGNKSLEAYVLFTSLINEETGEIYQVGNLPTYGIKQLKDWKEDKYYLENVELVIPEYMKSGNYRVFVGMTNIDRTRSVYLGDIQVE